MSHEPAAEPDDVGAVWQALVGERDDDDGMEWWTHLVARRALLTAASARIGDELAAIAERWHRVDGDSFATIGARVGLTRARAQQLVERGRVVIAPQAPTFSSEQVEARPAR